MSQRLLTNNSSLDEENPLEMEHVIGFTGKYNHTIQIHPKNGKFIFYPIGGVLIVGDLTDSHNQQFLSEHDEEISCISLSTSGKLLASAQIGTTKRKGNLATIIVWELAKKRILFKIEKHINRILSVCFSHDEKFIAVADESGKVAIYDVQSGQLSGGIKLDRPALFVTSSPETPDFNPKRPSYTFVQVCSWAYEPKQMQFVLTTKQCQLPGRMAGFSREYLEAIIDETGEYCYAVSSNGVISICNEKDVLYCGCGDGYVKVLQGNDVQWKVLNGIKLSGRVTSLTLNKQDRFLIAGTDAGKIYKIDADTFQHQLIEESHVKDVYDISFCEDISDKFCSCSADGTIKLWDLENYLPISTFTIPAQNVKVNCIIYLKDRIISGWSDGFIRCFKINSSEQEWQIVNSHKGGVTCLCADSKFLVSGGLDGVVRLWSLATQELFGQFSDHTKPVTGIKIDVESPHILHTTSLDKFVYTYDLKKSKRITYHGISDKTCPGFSSISQRLDSELEVVTCSLDGKIRFWDIDFSDSVGQLVDDNHCQLSCVAVSPSGKYLASCGDDNLVKIWSLSENKVIARGTCTGGLMKVHWSPDEKQVVTCAKDASICVWNFFM